MAVDEVEFEVASNVAAHLERLRCRAISTLELLTDAEIEAGFAAMKQAAAADTSGEPVREVGGAPGSPPRRFGAPVSVEIRSVAGVAAIEEAEALFDNAIDRHAAERFIAADDHHLLLAYIDGTPAGIDHGRRGRAHPDKGTEMFVYELGVDPVHRRRGISITARRSS